MAESCTNLDLHHLRHRHPNTAHFGQTLHERKAGDESAALISYLLFECNLQLLKIQLQL